MMNTRLCALLVMLIAPFALVATSRGADTTHIAKSDSKIFKVQQVVKSMFGPKHKDRLILLQTEKPEVLWITGIKAGVVGADGESPESTEFFCHSVLGRVETQPRNRRRLLGALADRRSKMFTLVQGMNEVRFPKGFGMPVLSNDQFISTVMIMNPSELEVPIQVGVDSRVEFVRDSETNQPMKPLALIPLVTKVAVQVEEVGRSSQPHEGDDDSCLADEDHATYAKSVDTTGFVASPLVTSESGELQSGHWYVPPGRFVYRHKLEELHSLLPFDVRAHYIFAHLHPFGESLELIDLTTGESVFKALANNFPNRIAVEKITHYSSQEGVEILTDHDYEIVATYNNTTDQDIDSMAVMYVYFHDPRGKRQQSAANTAHP